MKLASSPVGTTHRYNDEYGRTLCGRLTRGPGAGPWTIVDGHEPTCGTCRYMRSGSGFTEAQIERATDALAVMFSRWTWSRDRWRKIVLTVTEALR